jgi:hypothetical protein
MEWPQQLTHQKSDLFSRRRRVCSSVKVCHLFPPVTRQVGGEGIQHCVSILLPPRSSLRAERTLDDELLLNNAPEQMKPL